MLVPKTEASAHIVQKIKNALLSLMVSFADVQAQERRKLPAKQYL